MEKYLSKANQAELSKRSKSLAWRAGMMVAAMVTAEAVNSLELFNLPNGVTLVLGLLLGELSKYFSNVKLGRVGKE